MLRSTRKLFITQLHLIAILLLAFSSCKNERQTLLTRQNIVRMAQQNQLLKKRISDLRNAIDARIEESHLPDGDLIKSIAEFNQSIDIVQNKIDKMNGTGSPADRENLFTNYAVFQNSSRQFKKDHDLNLPSSDSSFLNLDKKRFDLNYPVLSDPLMAQNQLLLFESDVLMCQNKLLESLYMNLYDEHHSVFNELVAIAIADKCVYKKGEQLRIQALLVRYSRNFKGKAIIEGKTLSPENGVFEYSRKVTESRGKHELPVEIKFSQYGEKATFSARANFVVQ